MIDITSVNNQQIKDWKKLHTRKERKKTNTYLVEGFHLVEEALTYNREAIQQLIVREDILTSDAYLAIRMHPRKVTTVSVQVAAELSETETNQGIFAVVSFETTDFPEMIDGPFLLLDAVQDPGNVGTMIRTADAAGFQGVVLGKGTVDLYNSKTLRSAQGSHFHIEVYDGDLSEFISRLKDQKVKIYGTALNEHAESYKTIDEKGLFALMVGNEGSGISYDMMALVDQNIYIPMKGQSESLNVAIAASILMFYLN